MFQRRNYMAKAFSGLSGVEELLARYSEIESLQEEVRTHVSAIQELFARIAQAVGGGRAGRRRGRRPGRPAGAAAGTPARRGRPPKARRAKRGALRGAIHQVLAGGKVLRPSEIVNNLPKVGYRTASEPKVFYNTVYLA